MKGNKNSGNMEHMILATQSEDGKSLGIFTVFFAVLSGSHAGFSEFTNGLSSRSVWEDRKWLLMWSVSDLPHLLLSLLSHLSFPLLPSDGYL
jgi:hypothetical protein